MAGHGQVGCHRDASGMVGLGLEHLCDTPREWHGLHARGPEDGPGRKLLGRPARLRCDGHAVVSHVGDVHTHVQFDAQILQDLGGFVGEGWREAAQNAASPVEEQYPRVLGLDAVELMGQGSRSHFPDLPGQLHTGGSATGYREGQPRVALRSRGQSFGHLECAEQPAADAQRVVEGLHPWRPLREFLMAQVGLTHSDGDYQHVVVKGERGLVGAAGGDPARVGVEVDRFAEQRGDVVVTRELLAQRAADLPNAQCPGGALVEQRLEHVAGSAIKQRDLDIDPPEPARAEQPTESAPDDQHPCSTVTHHVTLFAFEDQLITVYPPRSPVCGSLLDETVYHNAATSHGSRPAAQDLSRTVTVIVTALSTRALHADIWWHSLERSSPFRSLRGM